MLSTTAATMILSSIRAFVREQLFDKTPPYLASDASINDAINRAYCEAVIRLQGVRVEADPDYCEIALKAGQARYDLPARIYRIEPSQVYIDGFPEPLKGTSLQRLNAEVPRWNSPAESDRDRPRYFVPRIARTDLPHILFAKVPDQAYTARLIAYRQVQDLMAADHDEPWDLGADEYRHQALGHYAAGMILLRADADLQNPVKAADQMALFERVYGPPVSVQDQELQKDFVPREVIRRRWC